MSFSCKERFQFQLRWKRRWCLTSPWWEKMIACWPILLFHTYKPMRCLKIHVGIFDLKRNLCCIWVLFDFRGSVSRWKELWSQNQDRTFTTKMRSFSRWIKHGVHALLVHVFYNNRFVFGVDSISLWNVQEDVNWKQRSWKDTTFGWDIERFSSVSPCERGKVLSF